jgi:hypothetical protein
MFHVKRFGTIEGCPNALSRSGAVCGVAIWALCELAIILSFGFVNF